MRIIISVLLSLFFVLSHAQIQRPFHKHKQFAITKDFQFTFDSTLLIPLHATAHLKISDGSKANDSTLAFNSQVDLVDYYHSGLEPVPLLPFQFVRGKELVSQYPLTLPLFPQTVEEYKIIFDNLSKSFNNTELWICAGVLSGDFSKTIGYHELHVPEKIFFAILGKETASGHYKSLGFILINDGEFRMPQPMSVSEVEMHAGMLLFNRKVHGNDVFRTFDLFAWPWDESDRTFNHEQLHEYNFLKSVSAYKN